MKMIKKINFILRHEFVTYQKCYIFNLPKAVPKYIYSKLYLSYSLNYSSPHLHCQMSIAPLRVGCCKAP